jgi:hypothetical protein
MIKNFIETRYDLFLQISNIEINCHRMLGPQESLILRKKGSYGKLIY